MVDFLRTSGDTSNFTIFFSVLGCPIRDVSTLTPYEHLFIAEEPVQHMVSELYRLLSLATGAAKPIYIREWEKDLGVEFSVVQLSQVYQLTHSSSTESKAQETNF